MRGAVLFLLLAGACAGPAVAPDATSDAPARSDASTPLPLLVTGDGIDPTDPTRPFMTRSPDLTCLGAGAPPALGPIGSRQLTLIDWRTGVPIVGLCTHPEVGDFAVAGACADGDPRTDAHGDIVLADVPTTGPLDMRFFPRPGLGALDSYGDTLFFDVLFADRSQPIGIASDAVLNEVTLHLGLAARDPSRAVVGAFAVDCARHTTYGADVRLVHADGTEIAHARRIYGNGTNHFTTAQPWTHIDGLVGFADVPVETAGEIAFVEAFGRRATDPAPILFACAPLRLVPGVTSVVLGMPVLPSGDPPCPELR